MVWEEKFKKNKKKPAMIVSYHTSGAAERSRSQRTGKEERFKYEEVRWGYWRVEGRKAELQQIRMPDYHPIYDPKLNVICVWVRVFPSHGRHKSQCSSVFFSFFLFFF